MSQLFMIIWQAFYNEDMNQAASGIVISLRHKLEGMEEHRFWPRRGFGLCIPLFQRRRSGFRASVHQHSGLPYSIFSKIRAFRETTLKSVRIMRLWPCNQRHG